MTQPELRFHFGHNWKKFQSRLTDARTDHARESIIRLLRRHDLQRQRFLDAGSGSGLFSLAARRLGATVTSFDIDPDSVACTRYLKDREQSSNDDWQVLSGSILDADLLATLGMFDVVYSWGVVHHTGRMWEAIERLLTLVDDGGIAVVAIYNDQGFSSRLWMAIKKLYNRLPGFLRLPYLITILGWNLLCRATTTAAAMLVRLITLRNPFVPFRRWWNEDRGRGMHWWYDFVDWVGGWPFEVAGPGEVFRFFDDRGFELINLETTAGSGCNEFVFRRRTAPQLGTDSRAP
ncbi:MAG: class I SAM-dependent methyltransferase [Planctomycetaceae bacterium]